ncbi:MAG: hypothetical protein RL398_1830 [Planctomycetota bacterium]|jgi:CheY-like chemotaxis protein/nitrogen-specific signal transduction histidine kinase
MIEETANRSAAALRLRIAELERAVAAATAATAAKAAYAATLSHEIRTPLGALLGMAELAAETDDPEAVREYLAVILGAGEDLLAVVNDALDLAKLEADQLRIDPQPCDLERLLVRTLRSMATADDRVALILDVAHDVPSLYRCDDARIRQVIANLVGNALKFTASGHVHVALRRLRSLGSVDELELVVSDTGIGIPPDRLQAIFAPFAQADASIGRKFAGTGLGLSITAGLLRCMGGTVAAEPGDGGGARFRVSIPLEAMPGASTPRVRNRRLLVALTDPLARAAAVATAQAIGLHCREVQPPALKGLTRRHDEVLLVDETVDDGDLAAWNGTTTSPPILLATSMRGLGAAAERCRRFGLAGAIPVPFGRNELAAAVGNACGEATKRSAGVAMADDGPNLRILVAEDDPLNRRLLQQLLTRDGHTVAIVHDGAECLSTAARRDFDVILLDVHMPVMDGLEATRRLRAAPPHAELPILALTADAAPEDRRRCLDAGFDEVLVKPVRIAELRGALRRLTAIRR